MTRVLVFFVAVMFVPSAVADTVLLKSSVRLPVGAEAIRLIDIAELEGPDAEKFAELVIAPVRHPDTTSELSVADVRAALDTAGVHWGRVNLTGNKVVVRPSARFSASAPKPMTGASLVDDASDRRDERRAARSTEGLTASTLLDRSTLRGTIARRFVNDLGIHPDRIRLAFDAGDAEVLDRDAANITWEVQFEDNLRSDRVTMTMRAWSNGRNTESTHVSVRPQLLTPTLVLSRDVAREEVISNTDFSSSEAWLPPSQAALVATMEDISGRFAVKSLRSGTMLRRPQLGSPTLVDRGDRVVVRCKIGGIVLSLQAEARADAAAGETIEFRKLGERNTFLATVTQRGEAVFDLGL